MGHLFRMLVLADLMKQEGMSFHFFLNAHAPSEAILKKRGYVFDLVPLEEASSGWEADALGKGDFKFWVDDRLDTDEIHARCIKEAGLVETTHLLLEGSHVTLPLLRSAKQPDPTNLKRATSFL